MEMVGVAIRWVHMAGAISLVGAFASLVLVVRPAARIAGDVGRERFEALDARLLALARGALVVTLVGGTLDLWRQVGVATGVGARESLEGGHILSVLLDTRYGTVWLARTALLGLLAALLLLSEEDPETDWLALRLQAFALGAASLVLGAMAGHAAAAEGGGLAMALDGLHLLATGVWAGGLVPLALCLSWTRRLPSVAAAARAAERFSRVGLAAVTILAVTGAYAAWQQVGGVPALVGTAYGRWLLLKLVLFGALVPVAARNLLVWRRRLAAPGPETPEAVVALRRNVLLEAALVATILVVVAVIGLTTPGRHDEIAWPLSFRFDWAATKALPGVQPRVAIGSQVATLGLVALLLALVIRPRRWRVAALGGGVALALGAVLALHPLAVDANPSTYVRPAVPYAAASIVQGEGLYRTHCQGCHGVAGYGDGPAAAGLARPPADLRPSTRRTTRPVISSGGSPTAFRARACRASPASSRPRRAGRDQLRARPRRGRAVAGPRSDCHGAAGRGRSGLHVHDWGGRGARARDWRGRGTVLLILLRCCPAASATAWWS